MTARRVLHLLGSSGHEGSGIARIVSTLALGTAPQGYVTSAYFFGEPGPLSKDFEQKGIPTRVIKWRHPSRDPLGFIAFWNQLRKESFDIIHVHWGGRGIRALARRSGAKVVLHLHGRTNEVGGLKPARVSTANADAVIAVSQAVAADSTHNNTRVIHSGVEASNHATSPPSGMMIGFAGRLEKIKGVNHLLRAMASLRSEFPHLRLEIAGSGNEELILRREASKLGLAETVDFLGWVPDLCPRLLQWRIFVQPSLDEGMPISILEAMAVGLPVIASNVGGIPEAVQEGVTGRLVPPADPGALAYRIREMIIDQSASREMGEAGRLRIQREFSSSRMVDSILNLYDELLVAD
jgi:glycosyltransferase involved in cell wall biosynthesis